MAPLIRDVRFHASVAAALVTLLLIGLLGWREALPNFPYVLVLFLSGALGGVVNTYVRLHHLTPSAYQALYPDPDWRRLAILQTYVSPLISGALGFLAYGLLVTGFLATVVRGELMPQFGCLGEPFGGVLPLMDCIKPLTNGDAAKALLWAFVGGFFEYLVPNILDQMRPGGKARSG